MARGDSFAAWCGNNDLGRTTAYEWLNKYPAFKKAYTIGYNKGLAYYESILKACMLGLVPEKLQAMGSKKINLIAVIFTLKTRFHREYSQQREMNQPRTIEDAEDEENHRPFENLDDEDLDEKLKLITLN